MKVRRRKIILAVLVLSLFTTLFFPSSVRAADLRVAGWLPYWRAAEGARDAKKHLDTLDTIYPFVFSLKSDGSLKDLGELKKNGWPNLFKAARAKDVAIIPTITAGSGNLIHSLLVDPLARQRHIAEIVKMVEKGNYDGVDIDYEGKLSASYALFPIFLSELKQALGDKTLVCTIEARTPPDSLYRAIPAVLTYANDLAKIGAACDVVQIMAYDQQRADLKLNDARKGLPYAPTADKDWVKKVLELMTKSIPAEKIMLGVPTYGAEYEVTISPNWFQGYKKLWALNPSYGEDTAKKYKIKPTRNAAGELAFAYVPKESALKLSRSLAIPAGTPKGLAVAARALTYANQTGQTIKINYVSWSDAEAVAAKVKLAEEFGLHGVAIFKIDGGEDKKIWDIFED